MRGLGRRVSGQARKLCLSGEPSLSLSGDPGARSQCGNLGGLAPGGLQGQGSPHYPLKGRIPAP